MKNNVRDLNPLATVTSLTSLSMSENNVRDLAPLATLTDLTSLRANANMIGDLSPLATLEKLAALGLERNCVSDLSPLLELNKLTNVSVDENPLSEEAIETQIPILETDDVYVGFSTWSDEHCPTEGEGEGEGEDEGAPEVVVFEDPNLEAAVRAVIAKPVGDIYAGDLLGLTHLTANSAGIALLGGIEYCVDLQELKLGITRSPTSRLWPI